ncbi:MAG: D-glycero-beta-D-manno-heptose-7-phosphate kinase [Candidatus Omnitrophota bacterium]
MKHLHKARLEKIINRFKSVKVLAIGDLMLDEFVWGSVSRISPEAPVPVVWVNSESFMPGGASNVANNIHALGATTFLSGMVGGDERGRKIIEELARKGMDTEGICTDEERPTTLKTRVIAHHQQVVRIDKENVSPVDGNVLEQILTYTREKIQEVDGVIIEDYGKGIIIPRLLTEVTRLAKKYKKIITVDPKEEHFSYYKQVTAITPNHHEAGKAIGIQIKDERTLREAGKRLLAKLKCKSILITLGENGMALFEGSGTMTHIPTVAQEVFDVTGAGDTVISVFTLSLAAGASMKEAAYISNFAAGIVVGKVGVAVTTKEELLERIKQWK